MRTLLRLLLSDFEIPFEEVENRSGSDECIVTMYCIPSYTDANAVITEWDNTISHSTEYTVWLEDVTSRALENLTEREALEYVILYLLQRNTRLIERVPYTPLNRNDPEYLIASLIEHGAENDETPDTIANKIITHGLLFNIRDMINTMVKEINNEYRR